MNNLIKIKEVSAKYDITARILRYYEDVNLITSKNSTKIPGCYDRTLTRFPCCFR